LDHVGLILPYKVGVLAEKPPTVTLTYGFGGAVEDVD
jgi:hypothetical protein